jgi:nucleoside-diphosphate-sugar epimerase
VATTPKRVLLTGAAGFVGASLSRRLVRDGHAVTAVLRPGGSRWRLEDLGAELSTAEVELADPEAVAALLRACRAEWVFHLAAHGAYSWQEDFGQIVESNLVATHNLLTAAAESGCAAFVHAGSSSEYGYKDHPPAETERVEPNSVYAVTKAAATMLCAHVGRERGLRTTTLRLYSVYGPWEEPGRFIPTLIASGLRGGLPPLVSPETSRDFVYVDDVHEAFLRAASSDTPPGAIYNIGSGRQSTVRAIVDLAVEQLQIRQSPEWGTLPQRRWDTKTWVADNTAARQELGWEPATSLHDGFAATVAWLKAQPRLWERYGLAVPET